MLMIFRSKFRCKIEPIIVCKNNKSHSTGKCLIGITPKGTVCFISKGWGGRTSDQLVTEN